MDAILNFLAMGGYAPFVWPAFGVTILFLVGMAVQSLRSYRARQHELAGLQRPSLRAGRTRGGRA
jgi:heme exporter protein D